MEILSEFIKRHCLSSITINEKILEDEKYKYLYTVEKVNDLVKKRGAFREAYQQIAHEIEEGNFSYAGVVEHTHEGSVGHLCLAEIRGKMEEVFGGFGKGENNSPQITRIATD